MDSCSNYIIDHLVGRLGRRGGRYRHDESSGLHGGVEVLGDRPVAGADVGVVPLPKRRDALPPRRRLRPRLLTKHKSRQGVRSEPHAIHQQQTTKTIDGEGTDGWSSDRGVSYTFMAAGCSKRCRRLIGVVGRGVCQL